MSAEGTVRWAILGVGTAGFARARAILRDPRSELVAVYRGRKAEETGAPRVGSVAEAIEAADAVAIASPNELHPAQVRATLQKASEGSQRHPRARKKTVAAAKNGAKIILTKIRKKVSVQSTFLKVFRALSET